MQMIKIGFFNDEMEKEIQVLMNDGYKVISVTAEHTGRTGSFGKVLIVLEKQVNLDSWG